MPLIDFLWLVSIWEFPLPNRQSEDFVSLRLNRIQPVGKYWQSTRQAESPSRKGLTPLIDYSH